jgi:hypothetical protein
MLKRTKTLNCIVFEQRCNGEKDGATGQQRAPLYLVQKPHVSVKDQRGCAQGHMFRTDFSANSFRTAAVLIVVYAVSGAAFYFPTTHLRTPQAYFSAPNRLLALLRHECISEYVTTLMALPRDSDTSVNTWPGLSFSGTRIPRRRRARVFPATST